jgi:hypothetical protein
MVPPGKAISCEVDLGADQQLLRLGGLRAAKTRFETRGIPS